MDLGLQGKVVLVTASSHGLGFATAKAFAAEGAHVMISSRDESSLSKAAEQIRLETQNTHVHWHVADVTKPDDIERLFQSAEQQLGKVEVLINNAGGPPSGDFDSTPEQAWYDAFELSLMSVVRLTRRALPNMRSRQWGRIVNFASSSIKQPLENLILSNTYRAAVMGLAKSLAIELGPDNILVNTLGPGRIATERIAYIDRSRAEKAGVSVEEISKRMLSQIPMGRYGQPDEFAAMAVFLGSSANGYITGQSLLVDGGMVKAL